MVLIWTCASIVELVFIERQVVEIGPYLNRKNLRYKADVTDLFGAPKRLS